MVRATPGESTATVQSLGLFSSKAWDRSSRYGCHRGRSRLKAKLSALRSIASRLSQNLNRIDDQSFRGSISGLNFAYCNLSNETGTGKWGANMRLVSGFGCFVCGSLAVLLCAAPANPDQHVNAALVRMD